MDAAVRNKLPHETRLPTKSLAERIRLFAISLDGWREYPEICYEFDQSLRKRTRMWEPLIQVILEEAEIEVTDSLLRLIAAWFTMIHLSAPVDQVVDSDPMSSGWKKLGPVKIFDLILALKDEVLEKPLASLSTDYSKQTLALAQATVTLSSATLTAAIGSYLDVTGALAIKDEEPLERLVYLYDRLVGWKSASIYRCLMSCLAVAGKVPQITRQVLEDFGSNVGYSIQVLDDAGGIWGGGDDLAKDPVKVTFPIAYGITSRHPRRDELVRLLVTPRPVRDLDCARSILHEMGALPFLEFLIEDRQGRCERVLAPLCARTRNALLTWYESYFRRRL
ncbi:MAG TPA: hypothetical protein VJ875_27015 [Pyrinomonadaceae bacterium]|nr:hypothetical protein [Pyrinomonadaceae bacterium]